MRYHESNIIDEIGNAIGKGLIASLAATAAITISQMIEMKITKRKPSNAPVKVASAITGIKPANAAQKQKVSQEIHWAYGTAWGLARGMVALTGLKRIPATLVHFGAIWGSAMIMLPKFKAAPPVTEQDPKSIAIDGLHHAVYALTAGLVYDALDRRTLRETAFNKMIGILH